MSETSTLTVLQRKAQTGQERQKARAMTAARAIRVSAAKAAEEELELALSVIGITETPSNAETLMESLETTSLKILLDAPDRPGAAVIMDSLFVGAIVQQQTMGRVGETQEDAPTRTCTRTDAALVAPWLDRFFKRAEKMPDSDADAKLLSGWRFGAFMAEDRLLNMALDAPDYIDFTLVLDVAGGICQGRMKIFLPTGDDLAVTAPDPSQDDEDSNRTLEPSILGLDACLQAALCRLTLPLDDVMSLKVGDFLDLPEGVLDESEILTTSGRKITVGKLGQQRGFRAIRLTANTFAGPGNQLPPPSVNHDDGLGLDDMDQGPMAAVGLTPSPQNSGLASIPDLTLAPGDSDLPDLSGIDLSDLPELPDIPGADLGDLPDLDDLGALPDLPDLPGMTDATAKPTAEDLSLDLPDLPDLPPLP